MSSDESTSTQLSTFSNTDGKKDKLKPHKSEPWEINLIGNFLLDLYHRSLIGHHNEWCIKKCEIRKEYSKYITEELSKKLYELNGTADIGTLLHRCRFLINTPRGSSIFKIRFSSLFDFRNNKLKELDNLKVNTDGDVNIDQKSQNLSLNLNENKSKILIEDYEVDENEEIKFLEYQGTIRQRRLADYHPTNTSCCICQEDFTTIETYEEHIQKHGEDTDFEFLTTMDKLSTPIFKINYRLCKNSHYFCFEIETDMDDLIIEKIIIVQSRSFYYVHNMQVPYKCPENGKDRFFVDSHLFTIHVEQPIVLIFHRENTEEIRIIEQHHFMRSEEFPKVNFSINPYRLPNKKLFRSKFPLADYFPPKEIQEALKDDFYYEKLMKTCNEFRDYVRNGKNLQPHNIGNSLNILLQIEDMDTILQYVGLTQKNVKLRSYGDEYSFRLKTKQRLFIENILSPYDEVVLTSNTDIFTKNEEIMKLILQNKSDIEHMKNTYVGIIEAVNTGRISFRCDQKINMKSQYTIICRPSRLHLRHQYHSLELLPVNMDFLKKFLFPSKIIPKPLSNVILNLYNPNINGEQLQAVRNIAEGPRNDATYIIFGPPGTGKTTTIVEGILQVLKRPNTKILVTASSNSACDEIAKRLCKYLKYLDMTRAMVRIYSRSSEIRTESIDDDLLENSNMYNGQFYPDIEILHEYRVVVCTLSVVAKLVTGKFGRQENSATVYTHLFIDEVAATTEAEALIGITTILSPKSYLIISGDHKQLGPILQSKRAEELGLGVSLMERLLARDCYRVDVDTSDYDRSIQTRLIRNYRSHPAIVNLYSGLYYNHSLEAHAEKDDVSLCEVWHKCRNKQFPIMFHAIYEPSQSDNQSHSLYNLCELNVVMDYVKDLMYFGINGKPVKESDIGIISPYKKQFKRIQEELNLRKWFGIETGSVETFQGKEKQIIIVSFVRSGTSNLGFLENPRRLNVMISRPKSLLILIGNPQTLSLNSDFEYIIKECQRNNTFVGSSAPKKWEKGRQLAGNRIKSDNNLSDLNKNVQALNIAQKSQEKDIKTNSKITNVPEKSIEKDKRQSRLPKRRKNKTNTNDEILSKKNDENDDNENLSDDDNEENDSDNDNEENDSDDDDDDEDDGNDQPSTSKITKKKTNSVKNRRRAKGNRNTKIVGNNGKIGKKYGKEKQRKATDNNKKTDKNKFDSILDELPRVPTNQAAQTVTSKNFTNPELLQQHNSFQQQQPQRFNNLQQQQQHFNFQQQPLSYNHLQQHFNNFPQQLQPPHLHYNNPHQSYGAHNIPLRHPIPMVHPNFMPQPYNINPCVTSAGNSNLMSFPMANYTPILGNNSAQNIYGPNTNEEKDNNTFTSKTEKQNENKSYTNRSKAFNKNMTTNTGNTNNKKDSQSTKGNKVSKTQNATKTTNTENTNNTKDSQTTKGNKVSKTQNAPRKSSKVAANIHGSSTNKKGSHENENNKSFEETPHASTVSKKPMLNAPNAITGENKVKNFEKSPINNLNQNQTNKSESAVKPKEFTYYADNPKSSVNKNITTTTASNAFLNTNSTTQALNFNADKPSTSANIYPKIRSTSNSTSTNWETGYGTNNYNPPTNPYLSSYSPSAPFVDPNEVQTTTSPQRPVRKLPNNDKKAKNSECCIS